MGVVVRRGAADERAERWHRAARAAYTRAVSEDLYTHDVVLWSERQAAALRRVRAGERVNDLDWDNLIEEVESLGRSETRAVRMLLVRALEHLLKATAWPDAADAPARRHEAGVFLRDARADWTPSMNRHLDVQRIYDQARRNVLGLTYREGPPNQTTELCHLSLPDLLPQNEAAPVDASALAARLQGG
jgi:hypothetical protein